MSLASTLLPIGLELAKLGIDAAQGRHPSAGAVARQVVDIGLRLVPYDELKGYLTEAGIAKGELLADVAEAARFSSSDLDEDGD